MLTATGLSHAFGDRQILNDVSFSLRRGERVGLIGQNGTGKSTLASVLVGDLQADGGEVVLRGGATLAHLSQEADFDEGETARTYILAGLGSWSVAMAEYERIGAELATVSAPSNALLEAQSDAADDIERSGGWDVMHRVGDVAGHLGIDALLDKSIADMSGGERRRIALARVLVARPALAILDEPTNHLDVSTIEWLESYLVTDYPGALLLITHDRCVLDNVVKRTIELDDGHLYSYVGGWESYLMGKADRLAHAARHEANRQNTLRRELEWLRRSPKARTTKQQARVDRAESLRDAVPTASSPASAKFEFVATRPGKTIIELSDLRVSIGGRRLIDGFDLKLRPGDRIGIIGDNGVGKTSLLRVLLGQLKAESGQVVIGKNARFAYFDQERAALDDDKSVKDNIAQDREVVEVAGRPVNTVTYLTQMMFPPRKQRQKVATLSGGERARVTIAKFLLSKANVLLLDEPTNDLDLDTLNVLEEYLDAWPGALVVASHDRYFLDRVATSVLSFEGDGRVVRYADSAQALAAMRAAKRVRAPTKQNSAQAPKPGKASTKAKAGLTFTEKHELDKLMPLIEEAETALAAIEAELADPELYAKRGNEVSALQAKRDAASRLVDERLARWEVLEGKH